MGNLTFKTGILLAVSLLLASFGQIFLKMGLAGGEISGSAGLVKAFLNPYVLLGFAIYACSTLTWMLLISRVKLSVAYPMISISYVIVMILSALILKEDVNWLYGLAGLVFIAAGVTFVGKGMSGGEK
ncbi:MAG: transporter [Abditibacteriota bacterium]|nr:transporter [Abditibacteriota bacterium]MBP5739238.1 transporter [Abditibacteriota bacterium]